jgi:hypothetical protein
LYLKYREVVTPLALNVDTILRVLTTAQASRVVNLIA